MQQDNNRFFRFVWRFNALVIAGGALFFLFGIFSMSKMATHENIRSNNDIVNVKENPKEKMDFMLGSPDMIHIEDYTLIPLYVSNTAYISKSSTGMYGSGNNEVNFLFLNNHTGESRWLLPSANQHFISHRALSNNILKSAPDNKVLGFVYTVAEEDTDKDGKVNGNDSVAITFSAPDGSGYKKLIEGIDKLYITSQIANDKLLIVYKKGKETMAEIYEVPSMKRISGKIVPQIELK